MLRLKQVCNYLQYIIPNYLTLYSWFYVS